ncbi:cell division protein SepF [Microcella frigidaquae]|uniref:Cell division protein SepF n=1 Tax=Microcella frigidaquae TaxID=424758 RepID=A0A840X6I9_9MICO|nr:cell division protein SepF [Microcella frigidaquae]MBB5616834.1 cell division inhibitor SepF [Microcella frigidaquae]NHN43727.1 cell division protein SepF [Microcella frigidaquae]
MSNPLRKTMVYLGLADEEVEYEQTPHATAPAPTAAAPQRAAVTPLRRAAARPAPVGELNEILTVHPRAYRDATQIAEAFREGIPVIMNVSQMSESEARRLVDFASGLTAGLHGRIERVTVKVFLLSPAHVATTGDAAELEPDVDAGFLPRD